MTEFWEQAFKDKQEMWGLNPAKSTVITKDFFVEQKVKSVLIPGIGYGRNAQIFLENGMTVTGEAKKIVYVNAMFVSVEGIPHNRKAYSKALEKSFKNGFENLK